MSKNPYLVGLELVKQHSGTSGQAALAKCILSLYNSAHSFSIGEILGPLDEHYTKVVFDMLTAYAKHGETEELRVAGRYVFDEFPRLVELSNAMVEARAAVRNGWEEAERKAELDALDASEAALFTDPTKLIPVSKAKELLEQNDPLYAYYNFAGDWRDTKLNRQKVHAAIDLVGGAELSHNCPENSQMLAVRIDNRIYYVCTDYDAREAYLDTIREQRKPIPRTVSVPPRAK